MRSLSEGDDQVIRDVPLRRGLNVVWAPPEQPSNGNALFQSGVGGHTAGKTTLCRLLRYALGEANFASEGTRRRIREKLPEGWIVAEVMVAGLPWVVGRPFAIGPHPFCVEGGELDGVFADGDRTDYQAFLAAVAAATTDVLPAGQFPARDEAVRWDHILPWLTRDQECRFADFLEWRHSSSHSDAPSLSVDERRFVVRSVLGLITDEERKEQQRNAELVRKKRTAEKNEPLLAHQASVDHDRVKRLLDAEVPPPSSDLFGSQTRTEIERRKVELSKQMEALAASDSRGDLRAALEQRVQAETNARRDVEDLDARLSQEKMVVKQLTARAQGEAQTELLASLPPPRDYCNVPMSLARERGCPLAVTRPFDLAERRSERTAAEELADQETIVQALEADAVKKRAALQAAEAATREARRTYLTAATAYDEQRGHLLEEKARLDQTVRLVSEAQDAWKRSEEQAAAIKQLESDIEASYARQQELRQAGREALGRFSSTFDYVVRALLGDQVAARVETSGRGLSLAIEDHGERDSAALATLKLWAFDLAAMTESIEGRGYYPRLLLHDGPREGDIAPDIYERLFLYAQQLEACFSDEPSFQYIVTTTTRPPDQFVAEPWLCLRLAGTPAEERLLRMDL